MDQTQQAPVQFEPAKRGRGRPKVLPDAVQSVYIAEEARALFLTGGYGGTTMDEIAARCRISKRTLYRLYPSKTELFAAIIDAHRQSMLALPGDYDALPLTEALEAIFRVDIDPEANQERMALLRLVLVEAVQFPELMEIVKKHGADRSRSQLTDWLTHQNALGRIAIDEPESVAKILMDMIFGAVVFKSLGEPDWPNEDDRKAYLRRSIRIFLQGVVPR